MKINPNFFYFGNDHSNRLYWNMTLFGRKIKIKKLHLYLSPNLCKLYFYKTLLKNDFYYYLENEDLKERYCKLVNGLDNESLVNVQRVLSRILHYKDTNSKYCFIGQDEKREIADFHSDYEEAFIQLSDNVWAYHDFLLPIPHFEYSVFHTKHNLESYETIDFSKSFIDVGAFVGDSSLVFSRYTDKKIYAFEALSSQYDLIHKTIELNQLTNVVPVNLGLSNKEGIQDIFVNQSGTSLYNIYDSKKIEKTHFTTLDKYVKENNIEVGFIKVDIEGAEMLFLEGAKDTIIKQKPALMISIYHSARDFFEIKPLIESWNLGYTFRISKPIVKDAFRETCLLAEVKR